MSSPVLTAVRLYAAAIFFFLWFVVGWTDFHQQKIRRRYLLYLGAGTAAGYAALLTLTALGISSWIGVYPTAAYYQAAFTNCFLCGAAAAALWWFGVWPAGDAKLFALLGALYPLTRFSGATDYRRLFLAVLINIFIPASIAVFCRAGLYVFRTRLVHRRHFLMQLGWKKELHFIGDSLSAARATAWAQVASIPELLRKAAADPAALLLRGGARIVSIAAMSLLSYYLKGFFDSPILFTVFWGGVYLFWNRLSAVVGVFASRAAVAAVCAGLLVFRPPTHWQDLLSIFGDISLFSFFFYLGIKWTMSLATDDVDTAYVTAMLVPLLGLAMGTVVSWLSSYAAAYAHTLFVLAGMGVFFGLSLVMVRLWDQEVQPSHIAEVSSYVVVAPGFLERLRQDSAFYEKHFSRLYPDGLTNRQARALRAWCAREGVEMIPLTPTISFASWIFFGFFAAWLMNGAYLLGVLI